jgi:hypothetical protein
MSVWSLVCRSGARRSLIGRIIMKSGIEISIRHLS